MPMPVSPRITAPLIQPPLGVQSNRLPSLSTTATCVVSFDDARRILPQRGAAILDGSIGSNPASIPASADALPDRLLREVADVGLPERPRLDLRVVLQRIAGEERLRGVRRIDQRRALLRVLLREQALRRHGDERGIGVVRVAIRVRELHRLGQRCADSRRSRSPSPADRTSPGCSASAAASAPGCRSRVCRPCSRDTWSARALRRARRTPRSPCSSNGASCCWRNFTISRAISPL